jgi:hypothetical protein
MVFVMASVSAISAIVVAVMRVVIVMLAVVSVVLAAVMSVLIGVGPRVVVGRLIVAVVMVVSAIGRFAAVTVGLDGGGEAQAGNAEQQRADRQSHRFHHRVLCCLQG